MSRSLRPSSSNQQETKLTNTSGLSLQKDNAEKNKKESKSKSLMGVAPRKILEGQTSNPRSIILGHTGESVPIRQISSPISLTNRYNPIASQTYKTIASQSSPLLTQTQPQTQPQNLPPRTNRPIYHYVNKDFCERIFALEPSMIKEPYLSQPKRLSDHFIPTNYFFIHDNNLKSQRFYESILIDTQSITVQEVPETRRWEREEEGEAVVDWEKVKTSRKEISV